MGVKHEQDRLEALPDFRNLGVMLRVLLIGEAANLLAFVAHAPDGMAGLLVSANWGVLFEVSILTVVLLLYLLAPWLSSLSYRSGSMFVCGLAAATPGFFALLLGNFQTAAPLAPFTKAAVGAVLAALILRYFDWRQRLLSPALANARLMALQSRIRPHFLFNSLNTAVALVRKDARLAEQVLLDMSDLFRALLADSRSLVPLADEIRLAEAYLQIEQLRLGERLRVHWELGDAPLDAGVPILVLQPLLENAVRYGVEPAAEGGDVFVALRTSKGELVIEVRNSVVAGGTQVPGGNRMALANIEERLALHFDAEANLGISVRDELFCVQVRLPLNASPSR